MYMKIIWQTIKQEPTKMFTTYYPEPFCYFCQISHLVAIQELDPTSQRPSAFPTLCFLYLKHRQECPRGSKLFVTKEHLTRENKVTCCLKHHSGLPLPPTHQELMVVGGAGGEGSSNSNVIGMQVPDLDRYQQPKAPVLNLSFFSRVFPKDII